MTLVTYCEHCGMRLVGVVDTVLHYERSGNGPSPCDRRLQRQRQAQSDEDDS